MPLAPVLDTYPRLRDHAREHGLPFERVLEQYAHERLLARLVATAWGEDLVLRGASAMAARLGAPHRRSGRLECLHIGEGGPDRALAAFREVAGHAQDDLFLDPATLRGKVLDPDGPCPRLRIKQFAYLTKAEIPIRVEVTFTDAVVPDPELLELPKPLGLSPVRVPVVRFETVAAKCLFEIVVRNRLTRRMADYFDLWTAMQVDPLEELEEAVRATFEACGTPVPAEVPDGLSDGCAASEHARRQWDAFLARGEVGAQVDLGVVVEEIRERVLPVFEDAARYAG